jgi:galactonate dehydratase
VEIVDVETILLSRLIPEEETWRLGGNRGQPGTKGIKADMAILKIHTDEDIIGIGEPSPYGGAIALKNAIEEIKPLLIGKDPFDVDLLTSQGRRIRPGRLVDNYVWAGVDMALWDIIGKASKRPIHKLLGGAYTKKVRAYASGGIDWRFVKKPAILVEEAIGYVEKGFTAMKLRIGPDKRFITAIKAVRDAVGYDFDLMIEGNTRFSNPPRAIKYAKMFERYEPYWFEEPIPALSTNIEAYVEIRRALPQIPITGGESKISVEEMKPWIDGRAYDIVQCDANVTGISELKRIAYLASLSGISCCPHNWHNAITTAANLQVVASIPNHHVLEMQRTCHWSCPEFRTDIIKDDLEPKNGYIEVPKKPGLGIELNEDAFNKYPFQEGPLTAPWQLE